LRTKEGTRGKIENILNDGRDVKKKKKMGENCEKKKYSGGKGRLRCFNGTRAWAKAYVT